MFYIHVHVDSLCCSIVFVTLIVWFQKISIPPPRRELAIPEGWGGGIKGPGNTGQEGVVHEITFPDGQGRCHANLFQNCF